MMNICFISTDNFVTYVSTSISSILENASNDDYFCFHIIEIDITDENKSKLQMLKNIKACEIKFYKPNYNNINKYKEWQSVFKNNGFPLWHYSVFVKLDIPFLLKDLDNVLYLDADSIVLDKIDYIFKMDIEDYYIISQYHYKNFKNYSFLNNFSKFAIEIGYKNPEYEYIGGGVLLFNLKKIRENIGLNSLEIEINECFSKYNKFIFTEEHFFLYIFRGGVGFLDLQTDDGNNYKKIIICKYFAGNKVLTGNFNKDINNYYYKFWEYFSKTQFFKDDFFKNIDIFYSTKIKNTIYKELEKENKLCNDKILDLEKENKLLNNKIYVLEKYINKINNEKDNINKQLNNVSNNFKRDIDILKRNISLLDYVFSIYWNYDYLVVIILFIRITFKRDSFIKKASWWIPIKKWRDKFRAQFAIEDQTRPDQTRPDQTRPDQT